MSTSDKDQILEAFTQAYTKQNGKAPQIEAKGGWYSVDGAKNVRLSALQDMISSFSTTAQAQPKAKAKSKPKKPTSSFSVKDFWIEHIYAENQGAIKPR